MDEKREDRMRPSRFLGYDRDSCGVHAFSRGMYELAESQFRRAAWLNPYEPAFKQHLAWCLYQLGRYEEAAEWIAKALAQKPGDADGCLISEKIRKKLNPLRQPTDIKE